MKKNSKKSANCNECNWIGPSGALLVDWDENDEMLLKCPNCESLHLLYIHVKQPTRILTLPSHKIKSGHAS